jgi:hypothetical protein
MQRNLVLPATVFSLAALGAHAVISDRLTASATESKNHFQVKLGVALNVKTEFQNVGGFSSFGGTQLTPAGDAYNYDDGYVLTDSSGNLLGYTRYWGYNYDSGPLNQLPGDGTILMNRYSSSGATIEGDTEEPVPGIEFSFSRELGRGEKWRWGIETAGSYYRVLTKHSGSASVIVARQTDVYPLPPLEGGGFVTPPPAPYAHGPELSPTGNPVIGATPIASRSDSFLSSVSGTREFEADVIGWRVGPYVELPMGEKFSFLLSGGFAMAYVGSEFQFSEQLALPGAANVSGRGADDDLVWGGYVSGSVRYQLAEAWELSGAVQFQHLSKYSHQESARSAVLDMGKAVMVTLGVQYRF